MKIRLPKQPLSFYCALFASVLGIFLGLIVLIGWYTHSLALIQINPAFVPMQYNTALSFVLVGLGLFSLIISRLTIAALFGSLTLLLGLATLIQYFFAINLAIDQLFMQHYVNIETSNPGRMAPNTSLCFALSGLTLFLAAQFKDSKSINSILGTLGVIIFGLGMVAFSGYFAGLETAYGWGSLTKMAIHTALGFIILGIGFFSFAWYQEKKLTPGIPKWLHFPIGIASLTITLAFWQALIAQTPAKLEYNSYNDLVSNSVLFLGTLLSLALVYVSHSSMSHGNNKRSITINYIPLAVLATGLFLGLSLFSLLHHQFQQAIYNKFKSAVQGHVKSIEYGITPYLESLYSIQAGFDSSEHIDRYEFHRLVSRLTKQYPGIRALEWVPKVSRNQRHLFEQRASKTLKEDFLFIELNEQRKIIPAAQREWYYPIYYIEPMQENIKALGFDLGSTPLKIDGLMKSLDSNAPAASHRIKWLQKDQSSYDFIVSLPVFKQGLLPTDTSKQRQQAVKGFAVAILGVGPMIEGILEQHTTIAGLEIDFLDLDSQPGEQFLYSHNPRQAKKATAFEINENQTAYQTEESMMFADRQWKIIAKSSDSELYPEWSSVNLQLPVAIFILSGLLAYYLRRAGLREIERMQMLAYQTALLDAIPNPIFVFNEQNEFSSCNQAYEQFFNIQRDDYLTRPRSELDFYTNDTQQAFLLADTAMQSINGSTHKEISITKKNGQQFDIIYWRTAFSSDDAKSAGVIGILIDISERKKAELALELSEQRFALTVAGSGVGLWDYNIQSKELWYSDRFRNMLGYDNVEDYPNTIESWNDSLHPEDRVTTINAFADHLDHDTPYDVEYRLKTRSGEYRWFHARGMSLRDKSGHSYRAAGSLTDITELKQAQEKAEIAQYIAEEANQSKSDFLANMSHEIRTPMNAVIGMSYLALQTELNRKQRNYIEKVHRSAEALLGIINDILDFSKIEAGKLDMETIDFRFEDVLENLASLLGLKAEESGLELLFDIDPDMPMALQGDPLRLGQILVNLGNNAIKFTEQGEIVLSTQVLESSNEQIKIQFSVRDTGIGMTEQQQNKLFQSFVQADGSITRKFGGTGLGLVISKKLTEMMNGEIWVESTPGEGTTFSFTAIFGIAEDHLKVAHVNTLEHLKVLVVDDNKSSREIMSAMLESLTYTATSVPSGVEAIAEVEQAEQQQHPYDLIIMDWKMPGMDGVATIRKLQNDPALNQVPTIIMVTAYGKEELAEQAKDIAHLSFLSKPTNASYLFDTIMTSFGQKITSRSRHNERQEGYTESVQHLQGANILLVEDNEINQELAMELLTSNGINITLAENGQEAVEKVQQYSFDGVLMDIQMPILDGYSATRLIRNLEAGKQLPIIAMTANAMTCDIEKAEQAGMNDHISKPINVAEMFCTMAKWISPTNTAISLDDKHNNSRKATNADEIELIKITGINTEAGLAITQGNKKLYRRLLLKFLHSEQNFSAQFHQAQQSQAPDAATRVAHTLKGVAGNIGAHEIQKAAEALELASIDKLDEKQIATLLNKVQAALTPVLEDLKQIQLVPEKPPTGSPDVNNETLLGLLDKLLDLLLEDDAAAVDVLEEIFNLTGTGSKSGELKQLEKLIEQYAYDEAIDIVKTMQEKLSA